MRGEVRSQRSEVRSQKSEVRIVSDRRLVARAPNLRILVVGKTSEVFCQWFRCLNLKPVRLARAVIPTPTASCGALAMRCISLRRMVPAPASI